MEKEPINFEDNYDALLLLVKEIEQDQIPLQDLAAKVNQARKLLEQCSEILHETQDKLNTEDTTTDL